MAGRLEFDVVLGRARPNDLRAAAQANEACEFQSLEIMVLGDFSGRPCSASEPWHAKLGESVDIDNFDTVLARMTAGLGWPLPGAQGALVEPVFGSIEDFEPDAMVAQLAMFKQLQSWRARLVDGASFAAAAAELSAAGLAAMPMQSAQTVGPTSAENDDATLSRLLGRPPQLEASPPLPASAVRLSSASAASAKLDPLLRGLLAPYIQADVAHLQRPMVEAVDRALGDAMRLLLRMPAWRSLESAWRSVDHFVRTVDSPQARLTLLDVRADELQSDMAEAGADLSASGLNRVIAQRIRRDGQGVRPALVVALYAFGSSASELALLGALAAVCAQQGAVLLASAAAPLPLPVPEVVDGMAAGLAASTGLAQPGAAEDQARWQALRASWMASHVGLLYPRVLARLPYGPKTQPVSSFAFDELAEGFDHERLVWRGAALDAAAVLASAHAEHGWNFDPNAHRMLGDYPAFTDRSGGSNRPQAGAEFYCTERQAAAIAAQGLIAVLSDARSPQLRLSAWRSFAADGAPLRGPWRG